MEKELIVDTIFSEFLSHISNIAIEFLVIV